jgi:serine/threonine protein kinase
MEDDSSTSDSESSALLFISKGNTLRDVEEDQLPYTWRSNLGSGACGIVEEVEDSNTGSVYARKLFRLKSRNKRSMKELFENEVEIIKSLGEHHHLIQLFATYTTKDKLGLIPVADGGDLHEFLASFQELKSSDTSQSSTMKNMTIILKRAFGCLAGGLAYMHDRKIRHKDIKAQNILIHQGQVIYTDFGLSFDSTMFENSTTEGMANMTRRYAAPEVLQNRPRNSSSDVFSLGCVFVEIFSALTTTVPFLDKGLFSETMPSIHAHLHSLDSSVDLYYILRVMIAMTLGNAPARLSAKQVTGALVRHPEFCCHTCWSTETVTDSETPYILLSLDVLGRKKTSKEDVRTEKVEDIYTGRVYVLKRVILFSEPPGNHQAVFGGNENTLGFLLHLHIMRIYATYTLPNEMGMLLQPYAYMESLKDLIDRHRECRRTGHVTEQAFLSKLLQNSCGCLANGLAFIHSQSIVVKNITPTKILIHRGQVLYSDFSAAINLRDSTTGMVDGVSERTTRYGAQEVLEKYGESDKTINVFSLGRVCLEILSALSGAFDIPDGATISQNISKFWSKADRSITEEKYQSLTKIIRSMMTYNPRLRQSAAAVAAAFEELPGFSCGSCGPSLGVGEVQDTPKVNVVFV